ncbi:MAG: molybdopterin-dependent oxidoreductase [Clostridia bacterium]|nr:molybdopterin-dependent oxidoreductase [Clostridia bacterium]
MNYQTVGHGLVKIDVMEKVTGTAPYVDDLVMPGMLIGKVLRSPYPHAAIKRIKIEKAQALNGVKAVITNQDTPRVKWNSAGFPPSQGAILVEDQYILTDRARFVGDGVAAVAAVDEKTAQLALDLIEIEYEKLPHVLGQDKAMEPEAPIIHEGVEKNIVGHLPIVIGDVEQGFKEADFIFIDKYTCQRVNQVSIEPCGAVVALYDANGRLNLWTSTQMPHLVRRIVARAMDMPVGKVRLIKPHVGGGFGSRLGAVNEPIAAMLSKATGKPVKLIYSREESFVGSESRHPIIMELKTGVKKDGTFTARQMTAYIDAGAYATHTPSFAGPVGGWFLAMYKSPNVKYDGYSIYTNTPPCGAFRGYGNPQVVWAVESQVDEIAERLGLDPREIRLRNHPCKGEVWAWSGWEIESCGLEEAIERGSQSIGWENRIRQGSNTKENSNQGQETVHKVGPETKKKGIGMAYMMHVSGARPMLHETGSAFIKMNEDGSVNVVYSSSDCGQGSSTALSQIAAEELGLPINMVHITQFADTDTAPFDIGSHASRQIYSGGNAVKVAAGIVKKQVLEHAATMLEVSASDLAIENGQIICLQDETKTKSVAEVAYNALYGTNGFEISGVASLEPPGNPPVYAAQFVEVEVDTETGIVKVIKVAAAHDVGTAINPVCVEGQIEGAVQQGLGYALTEEMVFDEMGRLQNPNLTDYKILTVKDMPEIDSIVVQAASQTGPFGAKSVGESGLVPTAAAVGNAIYDALGIRIKDLPITPEKVLGLLKAKS